MAIYIPTYNNSNCVVLQNYETIRVYDRKPNATNTYYTYTDYYYRSNYYHNTGQQYFSTSSTLPTCRTDVTTDILYRTDISSVLITFFILAFIIVFVPLWLFRLLFRK